MSFYRICAVSQDKELDRSPLNSQDRAPLDLERGIFNLTLMGKGFGMKNAVMPVVSRESVAPSGNRQALDGKRR